MRRLKAVAITLNEGESIKEVWNRMAAEEKCSWGDGTDGGAGGTRVVLKCKLGHSLVELAASLKRHVA